MKEERVIDLQSVQEGAAYEMLGANIKYILSQMFAGAPINTIVKGPPSHVKAFVDSLRKERDYLSMANTYGWDNPNTFRNKAKLATSAKNFERETGLKWPFK
jgi:hypothetical protein